MVALPEATRSGREAKRSETASPSSSSPSSTAVNEKSRLVSPLANVTLGGTPE